MNQLVLRKKNELSTNKKKGFTLVELIIVIAIIAILSAVAIPKFADIREDANVKADIATAKSIQSAVTVAVTNGQDGFGMDTTVTDTNLNSVINGGTIPLVKANSASKGGKFQAIIDSKGNVTIKAVKDSSTIEVLPAPGEPYK